MPKVTQLVSSRFYRLNHACSLKHLAIWPPTPFSTVQPLEHERPQEGDAHPRSLTAWGGHALLSSPHRPTSQKIQGLRARLLREPLLQVDTLRPREVPVIHSGLTRPDALTPGGHWPLWPQGLGCWDARMPGERGSNLKAKAGRTWGCAAGGLDAQGQDSIGPICRETRP